MKPDQISLIKLFRNNDHIDRCLDGQKEDALSQLCDIFREGHDIGLDWYTTGGKNNTARCGRKNFADRDAKDRLIIIRFFKSQVTVTWRAAGQETDWNAINSTTSKLPLNANNLISLRKCITYLAGLHQTQPRREGFWPTHYTASDLKHKFEEDIKNASNLTDQELLNQINNATDYPTTKTVTMEVFDRNRAVVELTLRRAKEKCEGCGQVGPFSARSDERLYLEVHHKIPLAKGGADTLENAIALCPNCHREQHFGLNPRVL